MSTSVLQEPGLFSLTIVNDDVDSACAKLEEAIEAHVPGSLSKFGAAPAAAQQPQAQLLEAIQEQQQEPAAEAVPLPVPAATTAAADKLSVGEMAAAAGAVSVVAAAGAAFAVDSVSTANGTAEEPSSQQEAAAPPAAEPVVALQEPVAPVAAAAAPVGLEGTPAVLGGAGGGGTTTLLDFGFGAAAGPAVAHKGMPVRQYMDSTVIPVLREGLKALNQVGTWGGRLGNGV